MWSFLGIKGTVWAALIVVGLIALAVISRNWSCRAAPKPRPPAFFDYTVDSVPNGATIIVKAGLLERRTATVSLIDVAAPPEGPLAEQSRANLERLAGKQIRVQVERWRLRSEEAEANGATDEAAGEVVDEEGGSDGDKLEGWRDRTSIVYGSSGLLLNTEQIRLGYASNTGTRKEWKAAEAEARKAKRGMWAEK